jgi:DnaJ family protein C protein 8
MTETFDHFYKDLKATEKADSVLTPTQQIDRLLRPGSTYRNLNPYEVKSVKD